MEPSKLIVAPEKEPVTLEQIQKHIRVTEEEEGVYLSELITSAREFCEQYTGRVFITQTWDAWFDSFAYRMYLPKNPVQTVSSVNYLDTDGVEQTVSSSPTVFLEDKESPRASIYLAYSQGWPVALGIHKAVRVRYIAGYGDEPKHVPGPIKTAIRNLVSHLYENREPVVLGLQAGQIPYTFLDQLSPYRLL